MVRRKVSIPLLDIANAVLHAYAKRGNKNWHLFDDLKKKPMPIKETKIVACEILFCSV